MRHLFSLRLFSLLLFVIPSLGRAYVPAQTTIITREDIEGRAFLTLGDLFSSVGAFDVRSFGNHGSVQQLRFRGLPSQNVIIAIDGQPMNALYETAPDLSQYPLSFIERVEITRGGSPVSATANGGGAFINLVTARPDTDGLKADLNTQVGRDGVKNNNGLLEGRSYWGDLVYGGSVGDYGGYQFNENGEFDSHYGKVTRSLPGNGFWAASYFYQESKTGVPNGTPVAFDLWDKRREQIPSTETRLKKEDTQRASLEGASPEFWGGRVIVRGAQALRDESVFPEPNTVAQEERETVLTDIDVRFDSEIIDFGYQGRSAKSAVFPYPEKKRSANSGFLALTFQSTHFFLKPGLRLDKFTQSKDYASPRLSAGAAGGPFEIFGSASCGVREPTFTELYEQANSFSGLDPERPDSYDLGLALGRTHKRRLSATGFFTRVEDAIVERGGALHNSGVRETSGVEGALKWEVGEGTRFFHLRLEGDWVHQKSRIKTTGPFQTAALIPSNVGRGALTQILPRRMELTNEVVFVDKRYAGDGRTGELIRSSTIWNARLVVRVLKALLYVEGRNLLQTRYALTQTTFVRDGSSVSQTALVPSQERAIYGGVRMYFRN